MVDFVVWLLLLGFFSTEKLIFKILLLILLPLPCSGIHQFQDRKIHDTFMFLVNSAGIPAPVTFFSFPQEIRRDPEEDAPAPLCSRCVLPRSCSDIQRPRLEELSVLSSKRRRSCQRGIFSSEKKERTGWRCCLGQRLPLGKQQQQQQSLGELQTGPGNQKQFVYEQGRGRGN